MASCGAVTGNGPPSGCGALLRVEVMPVSVATSSDDRSDRPDDTVKSAAAERQDDGEGDLGGLPKELVFEVGGLIGTPFSLTAEGPANCLDPGNIPSNVRAQDGPLLAGTIGAHYWTSKRLAFGLNAEAGTQFVDSPVFGGGLGARYRLTRSIALLAGLGADLVAPKLTRAGPRRQSR